MPVKKKIRVIQAKYIEEADSILIVGECDKGRLRHQIHSSCFTFEGRDKKKEMEKTAAMMIGKNIDMVFDPQLKDKIKDHYPLKY